MARSKFTTGTNKGKNELNRRIQKAFLDYYAGKSVKKNLKYLIAHLEHGTNQWSDKTDENVICFNFLCPHLCLYCYSTANATAKFDVDVDALISDLKKNNYNLFSFSKCEFNRDEKEVFRPKFMIDEKKLVKEFGKAKAHYLIMLPSSHDIFPELLDARIVVKQKNKEKVYTYVGFLKKLMDMGHELLITSKPRLDVIKRLCEELKEYREKIVFRFTITTSDVNIARFWESFAPDFDERMEALRWANAEGYETTVSMEPFLSDPEDVIEKVSPYASQIWLGHMDKLPRTKIMGKIIERNSDLDEALKRLEKLYDIKNLVALIDRYKDNEKIFWKSSIIEAIINWKQKLNPIQVESAQTKLF